MDKIIINEVGPRDGLQNIEIILSVNQRYELIKSLEKSGIKSLEVGSFVSEKAVPAMKGTLELVQKLEDLSKFLAIDILPKIGRKEDCIQNRNLLVSQYTFLEVMVFKGIPLTCDFIEKN